MTWLATTLLWFLGWQTGALGVALVAFVIALAMACVVGFARSIRQVRRIAYRLTRTSHPRIWVRLLDEHGGYLQVQIDSDYVYFGYAETYSNDSASAMPDLYLRRVATVDADGKRMELDGTHGLLIPGGRIRSIQFLKPDKAAKPPESGGS